MKKATADAATKRMMKARRRSEGNTHGNDFLRTVDVAELRTVNFVITFLYLMLSYRLCLVAYMF